MPVLTRSAARQLVDVTPAATQRLALREAVTAKADVVWRARGGTDVYTGAARVDTERPQVDHCLEVQLAEFALVRTYNAEHAQPGSMATAQAAELLRDALNGVGNLNVTSAKINQAKRGPFTAALNRLRSERLRTVPLEQLARQGRGAWMVDDGTWAKIEDAVVEAYDAADARLRGGGVDAMPGAARIVEGSLDELLSMMHTLGVHS